MLKTYTHYLEAGEAAGQQYRLLVPRDNFIGRHGYHDAYANGSSLDYKAFREYQPGDDLRLIDWNAYARSDRLIIKVFRDEVNPQLDLLIDGSRSMAMGNTTKAAATLGLAALMATAALNAQCSVSAWQAANGCFPLINGRDRPSRWGGIDFEARLPLAQSLSIWAPQFRTAGIRMVISDLLFPGDPESVMLKLTQGAAALYILQILAEEDVHPDFSGNVRIEDIETGQTRALQFDAGAQKQYQTRLTDHQQLWFRAASKFGAQMIVMGTEEILPAWSIQALQEKGILALR